MMRAIVIVAVITISTSTAVATDQESDSMIVGGQKRWIYTTIGLAEDWHGRNLDFDLRSSNWSGYNCEWEIRDSRLYLKGFEATVNGKPVARKDAFPHSKKWPLHATWFSGVVTVLDKPVRLSRASHEPMYVPATRYLVEKGNVQARRHFRRLRIGPDLRPVLKVKRVSGEFVVVSSPVRHKDELPEVWIDDVVLGIVNPNGFSINFTDESEELANAMLAIHADKEVQLILRSPALNNKLRIVTVKRVQRNQWLR